MTEMRKVRRACNTASTTYWSREVSSSWRKMSLRNPSSQSIMQMRFSHPYVRARLERLMGSNITRLTDRRYMQRLAERIQEEHEIQLAKRIRAREEAEVEREKKLILEGKIPVEQVPQELADHPVFKISRITSQAIEFRRSKIQHQTMHASYIPDETLHALARVMSTVEEDETEEVQMLHEPAGSEGEMADAGIEIVEDMVNRAVEEADVEDDFDEAAHAALQQAKDMVQTAMDVAEGLITHEKLAEEFAHAEMKEALMEVVQKAEEEMEDEEEVARRAAKNASKHAREKRRQRLTQKEVVIPGARKMLPMPGGEALEHEERASLAAMLAARIEWETEQAALEEEASKRDKDYMLSESEFRRLKYETPLIEELRKKETVADLYRLADEIVGGLWIGKAKRPSQMEAPEGRIRVDSLASAQSGTDSGNTGPEEGDSEVTTAH